MDAYGNLAIPGGTYPVLREKRTEFRETRVDAKVPIFGWQDVTDFIIAGGNFAGLGKDTVITYNFFSNEAKEAIAVVTMDDSGTNAQQVRFKNNGVLSDVNNLKADEPLVLVSPNPVISEVKFELKNFTPGKYHLQIFNANGALVLTKNFQLNQSQAESVDLSALSGGQYFYRVSDEKNTAKARGKLLKINQVMYGKMVWGEWKGHFELHLAQIWDPRTPKVKKLPYIWPYHGFYPFSWNSIPWESACQSKRRISARQIREQCWSSPKRAVHPCRSLVRQIVEISLKGWWSS